MDTVNFVKWKLECGIFLLPTHYTLPLTSCVSTTLSCSYLPLQLLPCLLFHPFFALHTEIQTYPSTLDFQVIDFPFLHAFDHAVFFGQESPLSLASCWKSLISQDWASIRHSFRKVFLLTLTLCRIALFFVSWRHPMVAFIMYLGCTLLVCTPIFPIRLRKISGQGLWCAYLYIPITHHSVRCSGHTVS